MYYVEIHIYIFIHLLHDKKVYTPNVRTLGNTNLLGFMALYILSTKTSVLKLPGKNARFQFIETHVISKEFISKVYTNFFSRKRSTKK